MVVGDELAFPATFLAALRIGAVPVPVSTMLRAHEVAALVADSRAKVVVASRPPSSACLPEAAALRP